MPPNPDGVAKVEELKDLEATLANNIFLYIDLDALPGALQMRETCLAHQPQRNDPSRDTYLVLRIQLWAGFFPVFLDQGRRRIRPTKLAWIRIESERLNLLELLSSLLKLVARLELQTENPFAEIAGEYSGPNVSRARNCHGTAGYSRVCKSPIGS